MGTAAKRGQGKTKSSLLDGLKITSNRTFHCRRDHWLSKAGTGKGRVCAVFNHSFDILVDNLLLNLNCGERTLHPLSILVRQSFIDRIEKNTPVYLAFPQITIGGQKFELTSDINPPKKQQINPEFFSLNIKKFEKAVDVLGKKNALDTRLQKMVAAAGRDLGGSGLNVADYIDCFGAGGGLTPDWDDFFAGLLLTDRLLGNSVITVEDYDFNKIKQQTTTTSYWQLKFAAAGKFSLLFENLVFKLARQKCTVSDFIKCLSTGHTSGTAITRGILTYLKSPVDSPEIIDF